MRLLVGCLLATNILLSTAFVTPSTLQKLRPLHQPIIHSRLFAEAQDALESTPIEQRLTFDRFDLDTALFCGGLAFDAYVEPPANSTRWERGSKGMNVAFLSTAFTRNLYKGLVEVTPISCSGLPDDDDGLESLVSGGGVDACILVAAIEGQWKEDIALLKQEYHEGILDLSGAAHIGRSSTAWANVNEAKSNAEKKRTGKALPYHIKKGWGRDAKAVWPEPEPFYIYVQDPSNVQLLFTVFDDDVIGEGSAIGSTYISLAKLLPQVNYSQEEIVAKIKAEIIQKIKRSEIDPSKVDEEVAKAVNAATKAWEGDLKLTSKPRMKNKNNQVALGMAAGALIAGPAGAALGAAVGTFYEGQVKGRINVRLRYLPIPQVSAPRNRYTVLGGMPGINWGLLYTRYIGERSGFDGEEELGKLSIAGNDLEHCFFINHDKTGGCCAVYRSLEKQLIVVSFRGTCKPVDLITDASIIQEPWINGEDPEKEDCAKVHVGFRSSMESISRRLKELILAAVAPGDSISDYDMLVTGHSLGGALATLFVADIGEFGIDAGRALPQTNPSDAWWKAIANTFMGKDGETSKKEPPRPRSLRLYNFGSPRVGNHAFARRFQSVLQAGKIDQAYRIVNDKDVVARMPRTMSAIGVYYDHCGSTVLIEEPTEENAEKLIWIEGESDDRECPVRDYQKMMSDRTAEGTLLGDLLALVKEDASADGEADSGKPFTEQIGILTSKFQKRLSQVTAYDITGAIGFDKSFTEREVEIMQALWKGDAIAHHMEDSYFSAMGRAIGFVATIGEDIQPLRGESVELLEWTEYSSSSVECEA